jgi:single-strand DNA-binding protein
MVNKVMLIGRLGSDPKFHESGSVYVTTASLCTSEKYKDVEKTEWHNIVAFRNNAEFLAKYAKKGCVVYIEGKIATNKYEKEGKEVETKQIEVHALKIISSPGERQNNANQIFTTSDDISSNSNDLPF